MIYRQRPRIVDATQATGDYIIRSFWGGEIRVSKGDWVFVDDGDVNGEKEVIDDATFKATYSPVPYGSSEAEEALELVLAELHRALAIHPESFHSAHEGYAVLLEEFNELWEAIRKKKHERDYLTLTREAIQIGAMALRFLIDCCPDEINKLRRST